jgi:hypothetical protein
MTDDEVLYEWAVSELGKRDYPQPVRQLVSGVAHSDDNKKQIVDAFRRLYLHNHKSEVLFRGHAVWSEAEWSRSDLGGVLMHPSRTIFAGCPTPPALDRFAGLPEALTRLSPLRRVVEGAMFAKR